MTVPAIRQRMVASLLNASEDLAAAVAEGLRMELPEPMPRVLEKPPAPEVTVSPPLSLMARPGDGGIRSRKVAILVADGVEGSSLAALKTALLEAGAVPRLLGPRIGFYSTAEGESVEAEVSLENSPSVLFDGLVLPDGEEAVEVLSKDGHTMEFVKDQYRHCKTILVLGKSRLLMESAGVSDVLPSGEKDPGLLVMESGKAQRRGERLHRGPGPAQASRARDRSAAGVRPQPAGRRACQRAPGTSVSCPVLLLEGMTDTLPSGSMTTSRASCRLVSPFSRRWLSSSSSVIASRRMLRRLIWPFFDEHDRRRIEQLAHRRKEIREPVQQESSSRSACATSTQPSATVS